MAQPAGSLVEVEVVVQRIHASCVAVARPGDHQTLGLAPAQEPIKVPVLAQLAKDGVHGVGEPTSQVREAGDHHGDLPIAFPSPHALIRVHHLVQRSSGAGVDVASSHLIPELGVEDGQIGTGHPGDPERADGEIATLDRSVWLSRNTATQIGDVLMAVTINPETSLEENNNITGKLKYYFWVKAPFSTT